MGSAARLLAVLALASMTGVACAQSDTPWNGGYLGVNAGEASNHACNSWTASGTAIDAAGGTAFSNRNCASSSFVGGLQLGDNFQYKRLVWGLEADLDLWGGGNRSRTSAYAGASPPPGTYTVSGRLNPSDFVMIAPRVGYAGTLWMPYVTAGAIATLGSHDGTLAYTPMGAAKPTASFGGGKNFSSGGWVAGGGAEWGLNGPWSIKAEYLHVNLGGGSSSTAACSGTPEACAIFSGVSLNSSHDGLSVNMFRFGITYWFSYWTP
ncbi:MAG: outer membrane beta-barrel protein [Steroidobacteraceae bacterium]